MNDMSDEMKLGSWYLCLGGQQIPARAAGRLGQPDEPPRSAHLWPVGTIFRGLSDAGELYRVIGYQTDSLRGQQKYDFQLYIAERCDYGYVFPVLWKPGDSIEPYIPQILVRDNREAPTVNGKWKMKDGKLLALVKRDIFVGSEGYNCYFNWWPLAECKWRLPDPNQRMLSDGGEVPDD